METPSAPSDRRSTRQPSQQKYKAAFLGNSPVRLLKSQTLPSAPGVTYNKTAWHVLSRRSSTAPTPALAYITTLLKYHGRRGRGTIMASPKYGLKRTRGCRIFFLTFRTPYFGRPVRQFNCRTN